MLYDDMRMSAYPCDKDDDTRHMTVSFMMASVVIAHHHLRSCTKAGGCGWDYCGWHFQHNTVQQLFVMQFRSRLRHGEDVHDSNCVRMLIST